MNNKIKVAYKLGFFNILRIVIYRVLLKLGINNIKDSGEVIQRSNYFKNNISLVNSNLTLLAPHLIHQPCYLGWKYPVNTQIPNWHNNILTDKSSLDFNLPWWLIPDFNSDLGDIKGVWEASRFDWVIVFAQQVLLGQADALSTLNEWLNDWVTHNPLYKGVNWKCGQEASIRVMHLASAAILLKQTNNSSSGLLSLVKTHLKRISPTMMYAVAQDNNHGTSEAAALYIGGSWLANNGDADGIKWQKQGLKWLENRAKRLIQHDGGFSQYSTTYHRVMLDTYSFAEVWRRALGLPFFSNVLYSRLKLASTWLYTLTQPNHGDAPNLGANDGARLFPLTNTDYRDFRPSVQLACSLFHDKAAYAEHGKYDNQLYWLNVLKPNELMPLVASVDFSQGGYACLKSSNAFVLLNYPKFTFRPSQCDALHLDLWVGNNNVFRDGGTYSYNAGQQYIDYYGGVKSHNTVEFDHHEQMPRLSRFLLGDWLKTSHKTNFIQNQGEQSIAVGYQDRFGCQHKRDITLTDKQLCVVDNLSGFKRSAILRWRLIAAEWEVTTSGIFCDLYELKISADVKIKRIELVTGYESRYYYQESEIPVLEIEIESSGIITTEVNY
jgi:hypothetical protein